MAAKTHQETKGLVRQSKKWLSGHSKNLHLGGADVEETSPLYVPRHSVSLVLCNIPVVSVILLLEVPILVLNVVTGYGPMIQQTNVICVIYKCYRNKYISCSHLSPCYNFNTFLVLII